MSNSKKSDIIIEEDDDFDVIECEEVILSDIDDDEPANAARCSSSSKPRDEEIKVEEKSMSYSDSCTSIDIQKLTDYKPLRKIVRKPARPVRLFSFTDHDIIDRFSLVDPAKKDLTLQLLNVVKSVNLRRKLKVEKNGTVVPNFYIIATNRDLDDQSRKISSMKSVDIVSLVKEIIHMIKTCVYREVDDIEIICDSPAIFLIKYVRVKNWDSSMNSVYVVTSEYLLPYLCKIRAAEEQEKNSKLIAVKLVKDEGKRKSNTKQALQAVKRQKLENDLDDESFRYRANAIRELDPLNDSSIVPNLSTEEGIVESILTKYLEQEAVDFFLSQMRSSVKYCSRFRWSDRDKLFALGLLRKNPTEYSILNDHYCLPSDKTLDKFMKQLQTDRIDDIRIDDA
ncbi:uncharacterized protein LOC135845369 [Planococcus citri]|uniref:uncharacterized protein LOC135845369 n=1 Tax=Planococcus citri TaxID=170843 RepID=UPI0031F9C58F